VQGHEGTRNHDDKNRSLTSGSYFRAEKATNTGQSGRSCTLASQKQALNLTEQGLEKTAVAQVLAGSISNEAR
jgi:hypothetical protein